MATTTGQGPTQFADLPAAERARIADARIGPPAVPKYSGEEVVRLGAGWFERAVKSQLTTADDGKFVLIDPDTGEYELSEDRSEAHQRFRARLPGVVAYEVRVGYVACLRHRGRPGGWRRS